MALFDIPKAMLKTPMDLWLQVRELPLVETLEALAALPQALDKNMRQTNELIESTGKQLDELKTQTVLLLEQMRLIQQTAAQLGSAAPALTEMAEIAKEQMALTTVQLERTNEQLDQVLKVAEPLDKMGQRLGKFLDRKNP